ncbi:cobalamin-binding protein [Hyunsoonleella flava]|uniref:Cobalamin-binding protein n=1 Tax=Hyunsoonleella flava TaxID=2527939 RepID=A0A4Q9FK35_9FLAO|nr:helical backbone metal receptor [Hyunsoonleella flava]TBN06754.1 cobalamin-binding protein [Hyunsoonleella flava]
MRIEIKDQLQRVIRFEDTPKRIVSLVPSQTELLCDLGLEGYIVGVTKFCVHPQHIKTKTTIVGGTKQINTAKIKPLQPDIILCNKEENNKAIVDECEQICNVHISDIFDLEDSYELIRHYGILFQKENKAEEIISEIRKEAKDFKLYIENKPNLKSVYFIWRNPWTVAANSTFINYMMQLNKFENIYKNKKRYPEIELKEENNAELVMLSSEPFPFKASHKKEIKKFYPKAEILLVDGEMFSWYGSRLIKAFRYFKWLREHL